MSPAGQAPIDRPVIGQSGGDRPTVVLVGLDTRDGQLWTWRWHDQHSWSAPHLVTAAAARRVRNLLSGALPGRADPASTSSTSTGAATRVEFAGPRNATVLGPLATAETEGRFSALLARLLFPPSLGEELFSRAEAQGGPVILRVFPSPSTAAVPWELLPVGDAHRAGQPIQLGPRLLDVADVVHVAPLLPRDSDPDTQPPSWQDVRSLPPLHVVDPDLTREGVRRILPDDARAAWAASYPHQVPRRGRSQVSAFGDRTDRWWLARQLPGRSRFFYLGHVAAPHADAQSTGLLLGCRRYDYSAEERPIGTLHRFFTARDAIRGTLDVAELIADAARAAALFGVAVPRMGPTSGPARDAPGDVRPRPGREIWPMPPRVALIGCRSGPDPSFEEPFGLVTAFLHAGAELVTATRWTLYTGETFDRLGCREDPLDESARAVDRVQQLEDPAAGLSVWQRERLASWRADGLLRDSPLVWAALATYDGRSRVLA